MIIMRGYIEIKEDSYEDTIEHLHRIKTLACKLIKMLAEHSDIYNEDEEDEEEEMTRNRNLRKSKNRYIY